MTIRVPTFLHEVLGESQTVGELLAILGFGFGLATGLGMVFPAMWQGLPLWHRMLVYVLIFDIFAGCVANFTRSTNDYYAARPRLRLIFIALHVQPLVLAWIWGSGWEHAVRVWGYTVAGALTVNALRGHPFQVLVGGTLLALGLAVVVVGPEVPRYVLPISLLFMLKVLFSFAVDHYRLNRLPVKPSGRGYSKSG